MNGITIFLCVALVVAQLSLPRKWAALPLIIGACYFSRAAKLDIGPFTFTVIRILAGFVLARIFIRGEKIAGSINGLDKLMITWTAWYLCSTVFTLDPTGTLVFRLGKLTDTVILYFAIRCFCTSRESIINIIKISAIALIPLGIEMIFEKITHFNQFSMLGANSSVPVRNGKLRASGPFLHAILAGTVGGTCFPMMFAIYETNKKLAIAGMVACIAIVYSSASSGPLMALIFSIFAMLLWRRRQLVPLLLKSAVAAYILLEIAMNRPAYYMISMIDLTGSSTGWHRSRLIESSFEHIGEWWFAGTEYTRHWMATGVAFSKNHADITNHYIAEGVSGGLPQFLLYIASIITAFRYTGKMIKSKTSTRDMLLAWSLGATLFAHAASQISVAYFDQSALFIYLTLATISSLHMLSEETQTIQRL
jgi:hypothetical protein